ncbi:MAG: rnhB [Parachlamydiales bacterium]|nr:rnhB [Parachlamydiales bacterium]
MSLFEQRLRVDGYLHIAGVDEAGRGPLAGPVVAAACILPPDFLLEQLNDSKLLSPDQREELFTQLIDNPNIHYGIASISAERIDTINILQATFEAMQMAVKNLTQLPEYLLIDGSQVPSFNCPLKGIVKGDALSISIAAASILAKVTRDRWMMEEAKKWPQYGFERHKGYGTPQHLEMLQRFGPCPLHRKSFEPIKSMLRSNYN